MQGEQEHFKWLLPGREGHCLVAGKKMQQPPFSRLIRFNSANDTLENALLLEFLECIVGRKLFYFPLKRTGSVNGLGTKEAVGP